MNSNRLDLSNCRLLVRCDIVEGQAAGGASSVTTDAEQALDTQKCLAKLVLFSGFCWGLLLMDGGEILVPVAQDDGL